MRIFATAAPGDLGNPMRRIYLHSGIDKECTTAAALVRALVVKFLEVHM